MSNPNAPAPGYSPQPPANHPRATTALVLGIVGLFCLLLGPVAFMIGNKAVQEIDASGGAIGGRSQANAGKILGIIGSVLLVLSIVSTIIQLANR